MRKLLTVAALLALWTALLAGGVAAKPAVPPDGGGHLSPGAAALLASLPPGEMATVVVTLVDRADLASVRGGTRQARLRATIDELRATADASQVGIRSRLRVRADQGRVARVTPLWISNAVSVTATADVITELAARADVRSVVPDAIEITPAAAPPTPNQTAIDAPAVWDLGQTGQGVVVANLDSGVDVSHPDLATRWRGGTNSWFDPYDQHATPTDLTGHGTGTMGVMVGGDASGTSIGTAPGATWIAAKIFNDSGGATATAVHQAFQWVLDPDHDPATADAPRVVNGSWSLGSGPGCDLSFQPDVQALRAAGILPVFAAGNFGPGASTSVSPANYPESLSVGAVSDAGAITSGSSRGPSTCGGRSRVFPDLVAPGSAIYTADRYGLYQTLSGTSLAAPHVGGVLALLLGSAPALSADQQQAALLTTAVDLGTAGPDETYGAGLVDARAAYDALQAPPPTPDFAVSVTPSSASVAAGDVATYAVQVTPAGGFTGEVTLSLTGLEVSEATWTFSPSVVAGGSGTSQLVVDTAPAAAAGLHPLTVSATAAGLTRSASADLTVTPPPPPPPPPAGPLFYSTVGNVDPAGVTGTPDDADVYRWDGIAHQRVWDASGAGLPAGADVDGYSRVDATHFYLSFADRVTLARPGPDLVVEDEDVVYDDAGTWRLWFDGSAHGLRTTTDIVGTAVVGGKLYFTVTNSVVPPGGGLPKSGDDADVYRWNSSGAANTYTRVFDATDAGLPGSVTVDALDLTDPAHLYLSFSTADATVPGLATNGVQDEDVVRFDTGTWTLYFDGTAYGLGGHADLDVDALDVP